MLVDVVLPVHRARPDWLAAAVASVRAQTLEDWRLHVVEDGCPLRSADAVVEAWPADDPRLRVLRREVAHGQVSARAWALADSSAPWIALLDQDDEYHPDKLAAQVAATSTGAEVVYVDLEHVDADGTTLVDRTADADEARRIDVLAGRPRAEVVEGLFVGNVVDFPSTLFSRAAHRRVGGFDEAHPGAADWRHWVELAAAGAAFAHVPRPLYRKRTHADSDGTRTLDRRNLDFPAVARDLRRRHGIEGARADQREADLRRRAARSAVVLGRRRLAARHLTAMVAKGQGREVPEVLADTVPALGWLRDHRPGRG